MSRFGASTHAPHRQLGRPPRPARAVRGDLSPPGAREQDSITAGSGAIGHCLTASRTVFPALKVGTVEAALAVMGSPAMATHLRTELVLAALNMAIGQRRPDGVVHHSDKGTNTPRSPSASDAGK